LFVEPVCRFHLSQSVCCDESQCYVMQTQDETHMRYVLCRVVQLEAMRVTMQRSTEELTRKTKDTATRAQDTVAPDVTLSHAHVLVMRLF